MDKVAKAAALVSGARFLEGWSQKELGDRAGVGLSTIKRIEQGIPPLATPRIMQKIAKAFGSSYDEGKITFVAGKKLSLGEVLKEANSLASRAGLTLAELGQHILVHVAEQERIRQSQEDIRRLKGKGNPPGRAAG